MRYIFILMHILLLEWSLSAHVTVSLNFLLFISILFTLLIDIDHILICPSTALETYFLALTQIQTAFLFNAISSLISTTTFLTPFVWNILPYLHSMADFSSFQTQVNIYLHVITSSSSQSKWTVLSTHISSIFVKLCFYYFNMSIFY